VRRVFSPVKDQALHEEVRLFFFFSNRLGCAGSLLLSAAATLILLKLLGWI
jgi:hypothetical protein